MNNPQHPIYETPRLTICEISVECGFVLSSAGAYIEEIGGVKDEGEWD